VETVRVELLRRTGKDSDTPIHLSRGGAADRSVDTKERKQIVVQWFDDKSRQAMPVKQVHEMEDLLETESNSLFQVDGHDIGSGTINIFLFADDDNAAVRHLIEIYEAGLLPRGMRIGVEDSSEKGSAYRPVYPAELTTFDIWLKNR
jgi:hypothetical protein